MKVKYDQLGYSTANAKSWRLLAAKDLINQVNLNMPGAKYEKVKYLQLLPLISKRKKLCLPNN